MSVLLFITLETSFSAVCMRLDVFATGERKRERGREHGDSLMESHMSLTGLIAGINLRNS